MTQQFEPFQKVLCRQSLARRWRIDFFAERREEGDFPYRCLTSHYRYCIPYEGNEHLLGTSASPTPPEPEFKFGDKVEVSENGIDWYKAIYFHKTDVLDLFPHVVMRDNGRRHELFKHCRKADW